jgi:hypothetical protein
VNIGCGEKHVISTVLHEKSPFKMCSTALSSTIQDPIKSIGQILFISWKKCISLGQNGYLLSQNVN